MKVKVLMSEEIVNVNMECKGFFRDLVRNTIPEQVTIYFVYAGVKTETGCQIRRLLYIGDYDSVCANLDAFNQNLQLGELVYYAVAFVPNVNAHAAEWALAQHFSSRFLSSIPKRTVVPSARQVSVSLSGDGVPRVFPEQDRTFCV